MLEIISNIAPGLAGMPSLHPMVVHFPIALLTSFLILDILSLILKSESLKTGATWMLYAGTIGTAIAVLAGFRAASAVGHDEVVHAIMETHEHFGLALLLISVILSIWRILTRGKLKGTLHIIYLTLAIIMVVVMSFTADYGGLMVYTHGVGIKGMEKPDDSHEHNSQNHDAEPANEAPNKTPREIEKDLHDSTPHTH